MVWWVTGRVLAVGVFGMAVLGAEAIAAATRGYLPGESAPPVGGTFGPEGGAPLRLAVLGDSTAAGVGARHRSDTVGARLAAALGGDGRRVALDGLAAPGARAGDLGSQVSRALAHDHPDVAVILIGANDAIHLTRLSVVERDLAAAVGRLRAALVPVVVGTCPDLGTVRAFAHPLRELTGWQGRRIAAVQARAVRHAGGVAVDLGARTGPVFRADPGALSPDLYHPSADGYRLWAAALLPAVQDAASMSTPIT
jgi:lysophospholipase L1-like esterase